MKDGAGVYSMTRSDPDRSGFDFRTGDYAAWPVPSSPPGTPAELFREKPEATKKNQSGRTV